MTPKEVRKLWAEALRSGEFIQGVGCLCAARYLGSSDHIAEQQCCLGVLSELYCRHVENIRKEINGHIYYGDSPENIKILCNKVRDWAGLQCNNGSYKYGCLATHNDLGKSFGDIANIIEEEPEELFVGELI